MLKTRTGFLYRLQLEILKLGIRQIIIIALKITADSTALCGVESCMIFKILSAG